MKGLCAALVLASAGTALAEEVCTFTVECYETEGCAESAFEITISGDTLVTEFGTIEVNSGGGETGAFVGHGLGAMHMLTRTKGGAARYTTHIFSDVQMVSYAGTCE
ncbi:hypothetical protein [Pseudaestuariivita sp.]|uniref:hypothetical protein n=1 Tax=Pseudaestuariivita sp. TaxID=2211669 RepID=UPI004058ECA2